MMAALLLLIGLQPGAAQAAAAAPVAISAKPPAAEAAISTASAPSPSTIYTTERLRDPFLPLNAGGAGGAATKAYNPEDFNIHNLSLRGIMKDSTDDFALFSDPNIGATFILRRGKLYDPKNKAVPGVAGKLKVKQRWAQLQTTDGDVQIFQLGEEEKE